MCVATGRVDRFKPRCIMITEFDGNLRAACKDYGNLYTAAQTMRYHMSPRDYGKTLLTAALTRSDWCADDDDDDEVPPDNYDWMQYENITSQFPLYVIEVLMVVDYAIYRRSGQLTRLVCFTHTLPSASYSNFHLIMCEDVSDHATT